MPRLGIIYLPEIISLPLTIFWIIGFVNTVNLIDGLDGLAAGIATIASIAIALLAFQMGQWVAAAAMIAMTGACLAFLQYNFNRRRSSWEIPAPCSLAISSRPCPSWAR